LGLSKMALLLAAMLIVTVHGVACSFALSSDNGPTFSVYGDFYGDFVGSSGAVVLGVTVMDEDGVDTVIGSISNVTEAVWHNVTLVESSTVPDDYYGSYHVDLPGAGHTYVSHVKYYANDTLGNWNTSNVTHQYLTNQDLWGFQRTLLLILEFSVGASVIAAVLVVVRRRRNRQAVVVPSAPI